MYQFLPSREGCRRRGGFRPLALTVNPPHCPSQEGKEYPAWTQANVNLALMIGSVNQNSAPPAAGVCTPILPPWASMI